MNETQKVIESIGAIASESARVAIEQYTAWHFTSAIVWITVGLILVACSSFLLIRDSKKDFIDRFDSELKAGLFVVAVIGGILLASNITNIFNSEACAIHQLLKDIRGE